MNDRPPRLDVFFEKHIGLGIRWETGWPFALTLSIAFPFVTVTLGFGKRG